MKPLEEWLTQPGGLAARLRVLRMQAGLSGKELATATSWQASKVSRLENGRQMPSQDDLQTWAAACRADESVVRELLDLLDEAHTVHLDWKRRLRQGHQSIQADYNQLVHDALLIRHFETCWIPGLLQTPDYARHVFSESVDLHDDDPSVIDQSVATRLARQRYLYDPGKRFEFLLTEAVLRFLITRPEVMRGQLDRLQAIIGTPNIRFGIIPFGVALATTPQNSFQMYDDIAIVETFVTETTHTDEEAAAYSHVMERLWDDAATGQDARRLIFDAAEALPST
ncbi:helix-turn-helix transcriptional regulator [Actinopolymorpha sp. B9G3]|uniref:helix-turn-helix domain-containing protein n=1 Tax=Actinopolymorpha sp. B9G3 TaxID=3158970 RepID=UPI0032D936C8